MKSLKEIIGRLPFIGKVLRSLYRKVNGTEQQHPEYWLKKHLLRKSVSIVQVGSNDGKTNDPIYGIIKRNRQAQAVFVEPVPYLYERLCANYGSADRFCFENSAINDGRSQTFFYIDKEVESAGLRHLPSNFDQVGSFDRDHIVSHFPQLETFIVSIEVQGLTLRELMSKYQIQGLDLLHIDAEGSDYEIIKQLEPKKMAPRLILFEHCHLSHDAHRAAVKKLKDHYTFLQFENDTLCILKKPHNHVVTG